MGVESMLLNAGQWVLLNAGQWVHGRWECRWQCDCFCAQTAQEARGEKYKCTSFHIVVVRVEWCENTLMGV